MIEPVALKDFFITFFSSALIIMAGASYALLFAWAKVNSNSRIRFFAYGSYVVLIVSVVELTRAANFSGYWLIISIVMVVGYFFAPIGIWHLCVKTHDDHDDTTKTLEEDI
jgi:ABC-type branched-subunit amino acid transport system permease subunit